MAVGINLPQVCKLQTLHTCGKLIPTAIQPVELNNYLSFSE